ncbi:MAG: cation diffusion facilitator family transporter [Oligoflexales bacterium]
MAHEHCHHGHHHHDHSSLKNIKIAFFANFVFSIIEFAGGLYTGSTAILADALHDFGDSISLALAYVLQQKSERGSNSVFSYGYKRLSLMSAAATGLILVLGSFFVLSEAIPRLMNPVTPRVDEMLGLAVLGVLANGFMAWKTHSGKTMNERMISWHLLEDVLGWVLVLIVSLVMRFFDVPILDPALSILFTMFIMWGVLKNVKQTAWLFLQASPSDVNIAQFKKNVLSMNGIQNIHDFHFWSLDGENHVLTMHVVLNTEHSLADTERIKQSIRQSAVALGKVHTTIEFESNLVDCESVDCVKEGDG